MIDQLVLSVDVGTTWIKFGLYDARLRNLFSLRRKTPLEPSELDTVNAELIYEAVLDGIEDVVAESGLGQSVSVIGLDGTMGGIIGIDEAWTPVIDLDLPISNNFKPYMKRILKNHGSLIAKKTGSIPINGAKVVYWLKEHPDIASRVKKIFTLSDYIVGKLAGLTWDRAFIDRTNLYLFALGKNNSWSPELCDTLGIPISMLPRVCEPWQIIGGLAQEAASACGLRSGIPLIAGCGDTAASFLGAGIVDDGNIVDVAGTCSVIGICSDDDVVDSEHHSLLRLESPLPGVYYLVGIGFGGEIHRWAASNLAFGAQNGYADLAKEAAAIGPGCDGLIFLPFLGGSFTPPDDGVRGAWLGLDWGHSRAHLYRSVLEGLAHEYVCRLDLYRKISGKDAFKDVCVIGGGSANDLWNQIKADALGIDYVKLRDAPYECRGTALVAGGAVGIYENLSELSRATVCEEQRYVARPDVTAIYREKLARYSKLKSSGLLCTCEELSRV
jgi:xylulokinase